MSRLKTFLIYALCIIGFWILSDFLINVGINSTYKPMQAESTDKDSKIEIYQAESTLISGKILGVVHNPDPSQKFLKLQLFTDRDVEVGTKYVELGQPSEDGTVPIDLNFKTANVTHYKTELVSEKGEDTGADIKLLPKELSSAELFWGVLIILMFW